MYALGQTNGLLRSDARSTIAALAASASLIAPGGLQVVDHGSGAVVSPGCCCGLETWREWIDATQERRSLWLGHDPSPWIQFSFDRARIWSDGGLDEAEVTSESAFIDLPLADVPTRIEQAHRDLVAFLPRLRAWAVSRAPAEADALVANFDRCFRVTTSADPNEEF